MDCDKCKTMTKDMAKEMAQHAQKVADLAAHMAECCEHNITTTPKKPRGRPPKTDKKQPITPPEKKRGPGRPPLSEGVEKARVDHAKMLARKKNV